MLNFSIPDLFKNLRNRSRKCIEAGRYHLIYVYAQFVLANEILNSVSHAKIVE